jgi:hypothetical protein
MFVHRAALHVTYFIATGHENPLPRLGQTSPEDVLAELTLLGHGPTFEAAKASDIVAEYKANGVRAAAQLLKDKDARKA